MNRYDHVLKLVVLMLFQIAASSKETPDCDEMSGIPLFDLIGQPK